MSGELVELGDICEFTYGNGLREDRRRPGPIPVYGSNGIVGWHDQAITHGPAIVVGRKGSIGEVNFSPVACFPIDTTYYIETTKKPCDLRWLYYALIALDLTKLNKSAAVPGLNREDAYDKKIRFPPLAEQRRIAGILDRADRLRRMRRYAQQMSETFLQAVFVRMFGDPVRNPMGWVPRGLGSLGYLGRGISKNRPRNAPELLGGRYPFIQTGDVANSGGYIRNYTQTYSELGLKQSKLWEKGTLCITIAANIAKTGILMFDSCFPDSVVGFNPGAETNVEFVQWWFSFVQKRLEQLAPESAQKNIDLEILRDLDVPLPPLALQLQFARVVQQFERLRAQQREAERQAEQLFQALLQRAFSGEL